MNPSKRQRNNASGGRWIGGYNAGEVASSLVTTKLPELYFAGCEEDYACDLVDAVHACNRMVHEASMMSTELQGMGTTLVAAIIIDEYVAFVNVGDSRGICFEKVQSFTVQRSFAKRCKP